MSSTRIHPTAAIEDGVEIGEGTAIWDSVHIRGPGTSIGSSVIVGEKTYIAYDVNIGNRVKINAFVYICAGVTIEDGVMISAGTIFTNDRFPPRRAPIYPNFSLQTSRRTCRDRGWAPGRPSEPGQSLARASKSDASP